MDASFPPPIVNEEETIYPLSPDFTLSDLCQTATLPPLPKPGNIRADLMRYHHVTGTLEGSGKGHAEGDVLLILTDTETNRQVKISADSLDYDGQKGIYTASGSPDQTHPVVMTTDEGVLTGSTLEYDVIHRTGDLKHASVESSFFRVRGDEIEARADGSYVVTNGMFTTCRIGTLDAKHGVPDYRIAAAKMTIFPNHYVSARRVNFYLGRLKLPPFPSIKRDLSAGSTVTNLILPGYDRHNGLTLHLTDTPISARHTTLDYNLLFNLRALPTGYFLYQNDVTRTTPSALPPKGVLPTLGDPLQSLLQQINPPTYRDYTEGRAFEVYPDRVTFYGILSNQQFIYNRIYNNLTLSRLPEVGIHIANILGHVNPSDTRDTGLESDRFRIPNAPVLLEAYASAGTWHESPSGVTSGLVSTRINFSTQPLVLGRRISARFAASNWLNSYTRGSFYELFAPEAEMDYIPTHTSILNVGYRYLTDSGSTPFLVDRRDIRHEMRIQYQVGGPYTFGFLAKFDMERFREYDAEILVLRNLDCLQYGLSYRVRSQQFSIIINLLPVGKNRAKAINPTQALRSTD